MAECPNCGTHDAGTPCETGGGLTITDLRQGPASPLGAADSIDEGRFPPGTLLGGRYRIIGLLGRGGMGEVYRANDLVLGQAVALKFLPESAGRDEHANQRLYQEVRLARRISHPHVCRVYDVGAIDGQPYISMEYVDGEDLGSLLRRIGRLPGNKALEIAGQLCEGLAAAHAKGILHRDLKPSNIMINGRGEAVITDFGLAGVADQIQLTDICQGTLGYMAPEQLAGRAVTARSDLYALGLVLYEIFTGKRPFEAHTRAELEQLRAGEPANPSSIAKDLDLRVERVILRCLSADARNRPPSAVTVAALLRGRDPISAALAWGQTPSPETVAAAGADEHTRTAPPALYLCGVIAGLLLWAWLAPRVNMLGRIDLANSPEALKLRAHDVLKQLGYSASYRDSAAGFTYSRDFMRDRGEHSQYRNRQPAAVRFWYRESPQYLVATDYLNFFVPGVVTLQDPPPTAPGMVQVELDAAGRLVSFTATPAQNDNSKQQTGAPDWDILFAASGLKRAEFQPADPDSTPPFACDLRGAWIPVHGGALDLPVRVEAAAWRGKPVHFQMLWRWPLSSGAQEQQPAPGETLANVLYSFVVLAIITSAALLARRNVQLGRGDTRGAFRVSAFLFGLTLLLWALAANHVPTVREFGLAWAGFSAAISASAVLWLFYVALEPYVRRRWPRALIGWSRLLSGSACDPLVGRDLLLGTLYGLAGSGLFLLVEAAKQQGGAPPPLYPQAYTLMGGYMRVAEILGDIRGGLLIGFSVLLLLFLLRLLLRNQWATAAGSILIFTSIDVLRSSRPMIEGALAPIAYALSLYLLLRFGLLAFVTAITVNGILYDFPITLDFSMWYSREGLFAMFIVLAIAIYGFYCSLGDRPLFRQEM